MCSLDIQIPLRCYTFASTFDFMLCLKFSCSRANIYIYLYIYIHIHTYIYISVTERVRCVQLETKHDRIAADGGGVWYFNGQATIRAKMVAAQRQGAASVSRTPDTSLSHLSLPYAHDVRFAARLWRCIHTGACFFSLPADTRPSPYVL